MTIPTIFYEEAADLLWVEDDRLLVQLSNYLADFELGGITPLGPIDNLAQAARRAEAYLDSWSTKISLSICAAWRELDADGRADMQDVVTVLLPLIAEAMELTGGAVSIAAVVSVIVARRGLTSICA